MPESNRTFMRFQWRMHKWLWNLSGGRLGRRVGGLPVLELVTIGRRSGEERQILINYVDSHGSPAIIGSNAGRDADPAWVLNLRANPEARARWDAEWHDVAAVELEGAEREAVWDAAVAANPGYATYAQDRSRPITIVRLDDVTSGQ